MTIKEMICTNYYPGDVEIIDIKTLDNHLLRDGRNKKRINGLWLGGKGDNQRCTADMYYIYNSDNLLGGK